MKYLKQSSLLIRLQAGFTLLELVLVLFLIGLLASAGLLFTENIESQQQYEETVERYERIRRAIIQSGERTVNGRPELRGFAVDMGRLPYCLAELLYTGPVSDVDYFVSPCKPDNKFKLARPGITENGIRYGWHGPYIQVTPDSDGQKKYRDGYGNDVPAETGNSGWLWELAKSSNAPTENLFSYTPPTSGVPELFSLTIQSSGFDTTDLTDNYPPNSELPELVTKSMWTTENIFNLLFINTSPVSDVDATTEQDWQLTLAKSGSPLPEYSQDFRFTPSISASGQKKVDQIGISSSVPAGFYALNISCEEPPSDCPSIESEALLLQLSPDHQNPTEIRWKIAP